MHPQSQSYQVLAHELRKALTTYPFKDPNIQMYGSQHSPSTKAAILLPTNYSMAKIIKSLARKNIMVEPMEQHYLHHLPNKNILKLDVSTNDVNRIGYGIELVMNVIIGN